MISKAAIPFATNEPTFCAVCQQPAVWLGYAPLNRHLKPIGPIIWLCTDTQCHAAAHDVYFADEIAEREGTT